jgi:LysM repeat protein
MFKTNMSPWQLKFLAVSGLLPLALGAPVAAPQPAVVDKYTFYNGAAQDFPSQSQWFSDFNTMYVNRIVLSISASLHGYRFTNNTGLMLASCAQWGVPNNTPDEISQIGSSIQAVSGETGVDARFILAVVMQESGGCVRAPTSNFGVRNPGIMQSHNGIGTCNDNGQVQQPCSAQAITQMIRDGTAGTPSGDGLSQLLSQVASTGDEKYFLAARMYNSGSVAPSGNLNDGIATKCYVNDVANRLCGWTYSPDGCQNGQSLNLPQTQTTSAQQYETPQPTPIAQPTLVSQQSLAPVPAAPAPAVTSASIIAPQRATIVTSSKMAPGVTTNCSQYYRVTEGDYCNSIAERFGVTFAAIRQLNTALDANCSNLWLGYDYCIKPGSS